MKKVIYIFLLLSTVSVAQDKNAMSNEDILINVMLENIVNYFETKNQKEIIPLDINLSKKDSVNWKKISLNKWQIIERKDSLKRIYDD